MEKLAYLKQNPREEEENTLAFLRANRMYEEAMGEDKQKIEEKLNEFDDALNHKTHLEIDVARKRLLNLLDEMEEENYSIFPA